MLLEKERIDIVEYCQKLLQTGLTKGTGGNISIFNREQGFMAISPSGIEYDRLVPEDVVVLDLQHNIVEGTKKPSSELAMHSIFYKKREDIDAVVHTHSTFAKTLSSLRWNLPAVSYLVAYAGKDVRCAKYASFGTEELAENAFQAMENRKAVFLANHGLLTGAKDIANAFNIAEEIEFCAEVYYRAKSIGEPVILDDTEMGRMEDAFQTYGQR
ncbi:L-fuculose-phosphate aldolase [Pseudogracilibacillus auburnensis]|uniref:L-fuculose 1-phosphate aldolase n=1 Tax=Pseudogracilibacillus auburnensis TaxID=1494959 RepID=A0A2V3WAP9_9BACI|nr:L-fuculose-phosphate aldolase [Pseudogracilibacillus auburnensis]MBO1003671.1 L-fuculose-phosphate aldolase [Pseudogracilibacillus auburnensis]PXW90318.1 L-fuculose 1-phosphate aldolase [Pseudogracilibacillus auburnensis]